MSRVQSIANINVVTKTEYSSDIMFPAKKEPKEHDYGACSLKTLSGDVRTPSKGDRIQDLDRLVLGQCLGLF